MSDDQQLYVFLDGNDKEETFSFTRPNSSTGADEAATGITGLTVHYSLTKGGATIHADVSKSLAEYASTPGTYHATQEGSAITTHLGNLADKTRIFAVVMDSGGNVKENFDRIVRTFRAH